MKYPLEQAVQAEVDVQALHPVGQVVHWPKVVLK